MNQQRYSKYNDIYINSETIEKTYHRQYLRTLPSSLSYCEKDLNLPHQSNIKSSNTYNSNGHKRIEKSDENDPPPYKSSYNSYLKERNDSQITPIDNRPLGLPNTKFYCYMNSVIQSLSHCIEFSNAVLSYRLDIDEQKRRCSKVDSILISLFFQLMHDIGYRNKDTLHSSSMAFQKIHDSFNEFSDGEQDADEYLQFLLNKLNDVTKSAPKNRKPHAKEDNIESFKRFLEDNDSFATRLFCGQMNNEIHCFNCDFSKPSFQVFWVLPVPITTVDEEEATLESCLTTMLSKEKLDGKKCSKCRRDNCVFTRIEITHWPVYFIIHLKRHIQSGHSYKTNIKITWNLNKILAMSSQSKYSLLGVIDHIGTTISGHYISKFRDLNDSDTWWNLNDLSVTKIESPDTEVITGNTTTYFFSKLNANHSE